MNSDITNTATDLVDDICGLIDDNDFADALDLISRNTDRLTDADVADIMACARLAGGDFLSRVVGIFN